jgi:dTDP-4-amino-4,6-dideoxygalactose transaminase
VIPQTNPHAQYQRYKNEIDNAIQRALNSGLYILGAEVEDFEQAFSNYIGCDYAIGVANGTDAIEVILRALDVGRGDEVITTSHTAVATIVGIISAGATPVLIDVSSDDYLLDVSVIESAISSRTKAIMPVHLYGNPANIHALQVIAKKHDLILVEDCSQAHGALFQGKKVGSFGIASAFSCYPTKNLAAIGDAGVITTNDASLAEKIKRIRQYGWKSRNSSLEFGINSRLDEVQAAILSVKLKYLDVNNQRRREIAEIYKERFTDLQIKTQTVSEMSDSVFHQFVIQIDRRAELMSFLQRRGISTAIHYPNQIAQMSGYSDKVKVVGSLNNSKVVSEQILSLPMFPELENHQIEFVSENIIDFMSM